MGMHKINGKCITGPETKNPRRSVGSKESGWMPDGRCSVVMVLGAAEMFCARKDADQLGRLVDQQWEVLRANPEILAMIIQPNQRNSVAVLFADQAHGLYVLWGVGHEAALSEIQQRAG
jgi:hypothetical protein